MVFQADIIGVRANEALDAMWAAGALKGGDSVAVLVLCASIPELIRQRDEYLEAIVYVLENRDTDGNHAPLEAVDDLRERYRWPWPHGHAKGGE